MTARPIRSALYIPGSKPRALDKARSLPCDAILFDLEDAVSPDAKAQARDALAEQLARGGYGARLRIVRINGLETPWGRDDAAMLAGMDCDGVLLPKVGGAGDVAALAGATDLPIWCMIETPQGVLNAAGIAAHPQVAGLVVGSNDLIRALGARPVADRLPIMAALQAVVLAARAHGVRALDGVYNAFRDRDGLAREAAQGRDLGFDGKTLIHPDQIATANAAFAPDPADLDLARRRIAAHAQAEAAGQGVAVVDGEIVESLHVETARALLAQADAIAKMERNQ